MKILKELSSIFIDLKKPFNENIMNKNLFSYDIGLSPEELLFVFKILSEKHNIDLEKFYNLIDGITYNKIIQLLSDELEINIQQ